MSVEGHRQFNPGWHLALDLVNMVMVSECVARSALASQESRGGHTRDDYPDMSAEWRRKLLVCSLDRAQIDAAGIDAAGIDAGGIYAAGVQAGISVTEQAIAPIRPDLLALFERSELERYLTADELPAELPATGSSPGTPPAQGGSG